MDYLELELNISPSFPWTEIIVQELANIGFESFTENDNKLQAFIAKANFDKDKTESLLHTFKEKEVRINHQLKTIPTQNWNATWEADYPPVYVDQTVLIRAPFHSKDDGFTYNIEIQPQMSFGTGHHQTTYLLCKALLAIDFNKKTVLDVGTGTGVLGILTSILGAKTVFGTDIEQGAVENAIENTSRNNIQNFTIKKGDIDIVPNKDYDVIIANINKNVLIDHMESYGQLIKLNGKLLLSGFFETDVPELLNVAKNYGFNLEKTFEKEKWAVIQLIKSH
ncbi:50S ribosomal protein L11 methyltransferase [Brumimicrobium salinarum]|uniref:50S ribosomal protein L11 methyltransferase n=1 Tax=Brumimicrobium salinarum TaxID=2058658 RepID=A0A2I0QYX8_9FLAO|nr:50S ribosomal protein L11 methyltransferase [Brumimicrobium salinarum]PKR79528.1 50S ribosomal protein L11 methyltransferase [Brumimicrobium salinarum]